MHGEAVAAGMVAAADLSQRVLGLPGASVMAVTEAVRVAGLPARAPAWPVERYLELMAIDKKAAQENRVSSVARTPARRTSAGRRGIAAGHAAGLGGRRLSDRRIA
ncbi:MAG: hypothetical protein R3E83_08265 [Burkholderiaceae bacterium]